MVFRLPGYIYIYIYHLNLRFSGLALFKGILDIPFESKFPSKFNSKFPISNAADLLLE